MDVELSQDGDRFFATIAGTTFAVGRATKFRDAQGNLTRGLTNVGLATLPFRREDQRPRLGFWADFLHPTASVEGGHLDSLNTYDRARFTFGFMQFAAHVPNGDFIRYLRRILALSRAAEYFPDLGLDGADRISRRAGGQLVPLENDTSTEGLLDYLNPSSADVEPVEVVNAAKLIHWVRNDPEHQRIQVEAGAESCRNILAGRRDQLGLDGRADSCCLVIVDILHQGRGGPSIPKIKAALEHEEPLLPLLEIGKDRFPQRVEALSRHIATLVDEGRLGVAVYDADSGDFSGPGLDGDEVIGTVVRSNDNGDHRLWLYAGGRRRPLATPAEVEELRRAGLLDRREAALDRQVLDAIPLMQVADDVPTA